MENIGLVIGVIIVLLLLCSGVLDLIRLLRALFELPAQLIHKTIEFLRRLRFR